MGTSGWDPVTPRYIHIQLSDPSYGARREEGECLYGGVHGGGALVRNRRHRISAVCTSHWTWVAGCMVVQSRVVPTRDVARRS